MQFVNDATESEFADHSILPVWNETFARDTGESVWNFHVWTEVLASPEDC